MQKQTYKKRHTKYRGALLLQVCRSIHNILLSKPIQSHPHTKNNNFACTVRPFGALACFNALFRAYPFSTEVRRYLHSKWKLFQCPVPGLSLFYEKKDANHQIYRRVSMPCSGLIPFLQLGLGDRGNSGLQKRFLHIIVRQLRFFVFFSLFFVFCQKSHKMLRNYYMINLSMYRDSRSN